MEVQWWGQLQILQSFEVLDSSDDIGTEGLSPQIFGSMPYPWNSQSTMVMTSQEGRLDLFHESPQSGEFCQEYVNSQGIICKLSRCCNPRRMMRPGRVVVDI